MPRKKPTPTPAPATTPPATSPLLDLARSINEEHGRIEAALRSSLEAARRAGQLLVEAKGHVRHGEWLPWLKDNVAFSDRTARAYMRVAERWGELEGKTATVADLTYRDALELLADRSEERDVEVDEQARPAVEVVARVLPRPAPAAVPVVARIISTPRPATQVVEAVVVQPAPTSTAYPPLPEPPPPPVRPSYPHSDRLIRWNTRVWDELHIIDVEQGGIKGLLADHEGWEWSKVSTYLLPQLEGLRDKLSAFVEEIEQATGRAAPPAEPEPTRAVPRNISPARLRSLTITHQNNLGVKAIALRNCKPHDRLGKFKEYVRTLSEMAKSARAEFMATCDYDPLDQADDDD